MAFHPFPPRQAAAAARLPVTLISLEDWALATAAGADSEKYLQGQVTADIAALADNQHVFTAHCDPKGKMWSNLRLFHTQEGFAWIERRSVRDTQLAELKKYAVFSKVTLAADDGKVLLGLAGFQARASLSAIFDSVPGESTPVVHCGATTLLWLGVPEERFIIITNDAEAVRLRERLQADVQFNNSAQWLALDIEAGLPVIDAPNIAQFIPQATNMQALGGISFKKGCYTGQEMVARAKYRGANKRALWLLAGDATREPLAGEELELKMGENWRRTGTVLAAVRLDDGQLLVQHVMSSDTESDAVLRVRDDGTGLLTVKPLPYALDEA